MAAHRCPSCNLINPANALVCDCGYEFEPCARLSEAELREIERLKLAQLESQTYADADSPRSNPLVRKDRAEGNAIAFALAALGLVFTLGSYAFSESKGATRMLVPTGLFSAALRVWWKARD